MEDSLEKFKKESQVELLKESQLQGQSQQTFLNGIPEEISTRIPRIPKRISGGITGKSFGKSFGDIPARAPE